MRKHFTTRLPDQLAQALTDRAATSHRSANAELTAILTGAAPPLSGTEKEPYPHGHPLHKAVFTALGSYVGIDTFEDGVRGLVSELKEARTTLQRMIDDSAALREKYEDLDAAVEQARGLL